MNKENNIKILSERKQESSRLLLRYPDRIPIIVNPNNDNLPEIQQKKFLVPKTLNLGQFIYILRKRIELKPDEAIFILINKTIVTSSSSIDSLYNNHHNEDGFLYMMYTNEATFG